MSDIQPNPKPAFLDWSYRADCKCERDFGLDRTIFLDLGGGLIRTPEEIAKQMIDMLPIEIWNRNTTFLDPCCKSGVFLKYISDRLLVCPDLIEAFPNPRERVQHIQLKQLHGIAWTNETYWQCRMQVNRSIRDDEPNSIRLVETLVSRMKEKDNGYYFEQILKENFGRMNFDVVIGNPPYNNDLYLDFVTKGHQVANKYSVWITPAKWQAKGGQKNDDFRKNIVPYMSKIVYYPDETDVFDIAMFGGVSYFILENNIFIEKSIENKCANLEIFNNTTNRQINGILNNYGARMISKLGNYSSMKISDYDKTKKYKYIVNKLMSGRGIKKCNNSILCPANKDIDTIGFGENYLVRFSSDNENEVNNFISYVNTKFVRFLILIGVDAMFIVSNENWRFVPDPGKFDHIFTDEELYKKYNLTQEEINIIESVIKERK